MQNRDIKIEGVELKDISDALLDNIVYALEEGKKILKTATHKQSFAPFTAIIVDDKVTLESYDCENADEAFEKAHKKVRKKKEAKSYAFCYDGFVETEEGEHDAIIAEGGLPNSKQGYALAMPYKMSGNSSKGKASFTFDKGIVFLGLAPNFFKK